MYQLIKLIVTETKKNGRDFRDVNSNLKSQVSNLKLFFLRLVHFYFTIFTFLVSLSVMTLLIKSVKFVQ